MRPIKTRAEFFAALAELHVHYDMLVARALDLGLPAPPPIGEKTNGDAPARVLTQRVHKPKRAVRTVHKPDTSVKSRASASATEVPIPDLSRPQACTAILRLVGRPLTTEEVIAKAQEIGLDWNKVSGGPANAVHGALWRERTKGHVKKHPNGPWELLDTAIAPELDLKRGVAVFAPGTTSARANAASRRQAMLEIIGESQWRPIQLYFAMKKRPGLENMPRHAIREDINALLDEKMIRKVGNGLYGKAVR